MLRESLDSLVNMDTALAQQVIDLECGLGADGAGALQVPPFEAVALPVDQLERLAKLRDDGILTDEEFEAKKKQILGL